MTQDDRRFGTFKFGTAKKFGVSTMEADLAWDVSIDWDGDGLFDSNEARRMCGLVVDRGRFSMLQSEGNGYEVISTGSGVITLWNDDGRFDAWNSGSPLYPNIMFGKNVRIRVRNLKVAGTVLSYVFCGVISDIVPMGYDERPKVNIYLEDGWSFLRNFEAQVTVQENIYIDEALGLLLDSIGWPSHWGRNLISTGDTIKYWWASGNKKAASECEDLANSFFSTFFIAADGKASFSPRTFVDTTAVNFDQSDLYKDIQNPQPWVNFRNVMQLKVHPRDESSTTVLYEQVGNESPIEIPPGESFTLWVNYTYEGKQVPALSVVTPVATTDYRMWTNSDGTGTNKTAECSVTLTNFGDRGKVVIQNNSAFTVYPINPFQIRGVAVYEKNAADVYYPIDVSTITNPRKFAMDLPWQQNMNTAQDFCTVMGPFFSGQHPFPTVKIESNFEKQFEVDLFDVVTMTSDKLGIGGRSFKIGGIRHETLDENCQRVLTTFSLEPYPGNGVYGAWDLVFDESTFGW